VYSVPVIPAPLAGPNEPNPSYAYSYDIKSADTYDQKTHSESRSNNVTTGSFSVIQPDGIKRTHTYTADPVNGFVVKVDYERVMEPFPVFVRQDAEEPQTILVEEVVV